MHLMLKQASSQPQWKILVLVYFLFVFCVMVSSVAGKKYLTENAKYAVEIAIVH
jgi:hypothetical protein